jgi:membrane protease YdiL (CAAX protease family)
MAEVVEAPLPPPPRPTWPTWVEILACSGYPTQLAVSYGLLIAGLSPTTANGGLSGRFVFALSLIDTVLLLSLIVLFIRRRHQRPRDVFFGTTQPLREMAAGAFSLPVVLMLVIGLTLFIRRFLPSLHNVPDNPLEGLIGGEISIWVFLFVVIVAGGVREELQRAFLLQRFRDDLRQPWLGLFITSLSFGMGHTLQGLDAAVITGALGAFWGFLYLTRGGALASMVSHSLFNSGELLRVLTGG